MLTPLVQDLIVLSPTTTDFTNEISLGVDIPFYFMPVDKNGDTLNDKELKVEMNVLQVPFFVSGRDVDIKKVISFTFDDQTGVAPSVTNPPPQKTNDTGVIKYKYNVEPFSYSLASKLMLDTQESMWSTSRQMEPSLSHSF